MGAVKEDTLKGISDTLDQTDGTVCFHKRRQNDLEDRLCATLPIIISIFTAYFIFSLEFRKLSPTFIFLSTAMAIALTAASLIPATKHVNRASRIYLGFSAGSLFLFAAIAVYLAEA